MALAAYQAITLRLLNDPTNAVYPIGDVTAAINTGRRQIAGATHCIRYTATRSTVAATADYPLSTFSGGVGTGVPLAAQMGECAGNFLAQREWEWFFKYYVSKPVRATGRPQRWAIQEPGPFGNISLDPVPDAVYPLFFDVVGTPIDLISDST